jgi:hypothetical protein
MDKLPHLWRAPRHRSACRWAIPGHAVSGDNFRLSRVSEFRAKSWHWVGSGVGHSHMTTLLADCRATRDGAVPRSEIAGRSWPIQPAAGNAGWASGFQLEPHRPGVPEPVRSAT